MLINTYEMTDIQFNALIETAKKYDSNAVKEFIADIAYQEWMDNYSDADVGEPMSEAECKEINSVLTEIFTEVHSDDFGDEGNAFKAFREETAMTIAETAEYFGIPERTVLSWNCGDRECSPYLLSLMRYKAEHEGLCGSDTLWSGEYGKITGSNDDDFCTIFTEGTETAVDLWNEVKAAFPSADNFFCFKQAIKSARK